jgi:hypothetical protein
MWSPRSLQHASANLFHKYTDNNNAERHPWDLRTVPAFILTIFMLVTFILLCIADALPRWSKGRSVPEYVAYGGGRTVVFYPAADITIGLFYMCVSNSCFRYGVTPENCNGERWCQQVQACRAFMLASACFAGLAFISFGVRLAASRFASGTGAPMWLNIFGAVMTIVTAVTSLIGWSLGVDISLNSDTLINTADSCVYFALAAVILSIIAAILAFILLLKQYCCGSLSSGFDTLNQAGEHEALHPHAMANANYQKQLSPQPNRFDGHDALYDSQRFNVNPIHQRAQ